MNAQNYEEYWKLTLEYTDFNDEKFRITLQTIVSKIDFLNQNGDYVYQTKDYQELQREILAKIPKTSSRKNQLASTRKAINQCVKLGFINSKLKSYHPLTKEYLHAKTGRKRKTLLSRIVYDNSSFNRSITNESGLQQLNFLINTLVENGQLSKGEIIALMLVDLSSVRKKFLNKEELKEYSEKATISGFISRKYNQIGYLNNILNKLDEIVFVNNELYFTEDAKRIFGEEIEIVIRRRNPYLHLLYKNQLKEESYSIFEMEKCMVENRSYPVLIASHIKPFAKCDNDNEAYDVNNGILLSKNMDSLFDLGYITFDDFGNILFAEKLDENVREFVSQYKLNEKFLNEKRLEYMKFHRAEVFKKRFKYA